MNIFHFFLLQDESEATTSFLVQLSTWDKEELDEKLANRVQVSKRAVAKVIQAFDRLMQRNEKITLALKGEFEGGINSELLKSLCYNFESKIRKLVFIINSIKHL